MRGLPDIRSADGSRCPAPVVDRQCGLDVLVVVLQRDACKTRTGVRSLEGRGIFEHLGLLGEY